MALYKSPPLVIGLFLFVIACNFHISEQAYSNSPVNGSNEMAMASEDEGPDQIKDRRKRLLLKDTNRHWSKGDVPYRFGVVDPRNLVHIYGAMTIFEYFTPIRFRQKKSETEQHIYIYTTWQRGLSVLGYREESKDGQVLHCYPTSTCVHEFGHALGMSHEQYHPERDMWMQVNKDVLGTSESENYKKEGWGQFSYTHFDMSSFMLYGPRGYSRSYSFTFKELSNEFRLFYMLKELSMLYRFDRYPQCSNFKMECINEGYISVVNDKCTCICVSGLDPLTGCRELLKKGPSWPTGSFTLASHIDGCPDGFHEGRWDITGIGKNRAVHKLDLIKAQISDKNKDIRFNFCTRNTHSDESKYTWPPGNYCFFRQGEKCPDQKGIYRAGIHIPGTNAKTAGAVPADLDKNTTLEFCCSVNGFSYIPAQFPNEKPFIMFATEGKGCQEIDGMYGEKKTLSIRKASLVTYGDEGVKVNGYTRDGLLHFESCGYTPLKRDCGGIMEVGPNNKEVTIESDRSNPSWSQCTWIVQSSEQSKGTLVFTFDELHISNNGEDCVEVQPSLIAQKGIMYCGGEMKDRSIQTLYNKLRVQFKTYSDSKSYFKATVKWVADSDQCYNAADRGSNYRGTVDFTRNFKKCIPWSKAKKCLHDPYRIKNYFSGLEKNYCRNPDGSFRPWCYTKEEGCERDFCDVCHIEKAYDTGNTKRCEQQSRNGQCHRDSLDCADSCRIAQQSSVNSVSSIHCKHPRKVTFGSLQGQQKHKYAVGDKLTYKCLHSDNTIDRTCLTNGQWSTARIACLPCENGFINYRDKCYKFVEKFVSRGAAEKECHGMGAGLATPKSTLENKFVSSIRYRLNKVWLGVKFDKDSDKYKADGKPLTYTNWIYYGENTNKGECVALNVYEYWDDRDYCSDLKNFVCEKPVTKAPPVCGDFLDNCQELVKEAPDSICDMRPGLESYCRYSCGRCPNSCGQEINLNVDRRKHTLKADRRNQKNKYCAWTIKVPNKKGMLALTITEFDVKAVGDKCVDSLEVRPTEYADNYTKFCGNNYKRSILTAHDQMFVAFRTPDYYRSRSYFSAEIEWFPEPKTCKESNNVDNCYTDSEMCYKVEDKGRSYDGEVSYTQYLKSCLPWDKAMKCPHNPVKLTANLKENFCRNPGGRSRPWCYVNEQCDMEYCDVCHKAKQFDLSNDCTQTKRAGKCDKNSKDCALTCEIDKAHNIRRASDLKCQTPGSIVGGRLTNRKRTYSVNEKATYKCGNSNDISVKRTCLTSGAWTSAACLPCSTSSYSFKSKCYTFMEMLMNYPNAERECKKFNSRVATPKTKEENWYLHGLSYNKSLINDKDHDIWIGAKKKNDQFYWNDNTRLTWNSWAEKNKAASKRFDCVSMNSYEQWNDRLCAKSRWYICPSCKYEKQFICERNGADNIGCADFLDNCPHLLSLTKKSKCELNSKMESLCRKTCGLC